jgi:hypothetical protein
MSYQQSGWPFDDELFKQVDLFEQLKAQASELIMEDGESLAAMAFDIGEALGIGSEEFNEDRYNALCEVFLTHAIHLSMGKIVPVLLRLLREQDMAFLEQLSDRCHPNWININRTGEKRIVH